MRKLFCFILAIAITINVSSQQPLKMSYQAVIRNNNNQLITSQTVKMKISILQGSPTGNVVYSETISSITNANGLVSIEFGGLNGYDAINWANGPFFIKTETDPTGNTNFSITGISQVLSVPYALFASKTLNQSGINTGDETENSIKSKLGITTLSGSNTGDETTNSIKSKLNIVTLSGINTGDETTETIKSKLGITAISGVNTGDETAETIRFKISTDLNNKVDKISGKGLSSNDYTTTEKNKLTGIATGAEVNVNADWNATSGDAMILNKPTIDGSETKIQEGSNIVITGNGTNANPYVINSTNTSSNSYYLGQEKDGGVIFYIYRGNDGLEHGLIVSKTEETKAWGIYNGNLTNGTSTCNGSANTALMPSSYQAVTWVYSLGDGWYLPAIDELNILYWNRYHVNKSGVSGLTLLSYGYYWSSTEYSRNEAFSLNFFTGYADFEQSKSLSYKVRAIRSF